MKESKFINKATIEYLKSKAGDTTDQKITRLRQELISDYDDHLKRLTELKYKLEDGDLELKNRTDALGTAVSFIQAELGSINQITGSLKYENFLLKRKVKKLIIGLTTGLTIALIGVAACLVKLLT